MNMFRALRAEEIDCRISQIKKYDDGPNKGKPKGLSLLLYKDARCDQNILDETVGAYNWKREHTRENRNCIVSLWDEKKQQWISKEDTGTESNTEKEKGLASDSFKRACFNWGIGRELYTAPFIWIDASKCNIREWGGKLQCYDRFTVVGIGVTDGVITGLKIKNQNTNKVVYEWGTIDETAPVKPEQPDNEPDNEQPSIQPVRQETKADVQIVPTVQATETQVKKYIAKELSFMKQMFGITDTEKMNQKFMAMRQGLIEAGIIKDKKSDEQTMEEAQQMIEAIYANFKPSGDAA